MAASTTATRTAHRGPQPMSAAESVTSDSAASDNEEDSEAEEDSGSEAESSADGFDADSQASDDDAPPAESDEDSEASEAEATDDSAASDEEPASPAKPVARSLVVKPSVKKPTVSTGKAQRLRGGAGSGDETEASPTANTSSSNKGNTLKKKNRPQATSPATSVPSRSIPPNDGKLRKSKPGGTARGRPVGAGDVEDDEAEASEEEDPKKGTVKDRSDDATIRSHTADPFSAAAKQDAWRAIFYSVTEPDPAKVVLEEHGNEEFEHSIVSPALHLAHFESTGVNTFKLVMYDLEDFEPSTPPVTIASGQKTPSRLGWHSFKVERVSTEIPGSIKGGTRPKTPDKEEIEDIAAAFAEEGHGGLDPGDPETIETLKRAVRLKIGKVSPEALKEFEKQGNKGKVGAADVVDSGTVGTSTGQRERKKTVPESADDEEEQKGSKSPDAENDEDEPVAGTGNGKALPKK